MHAFRLFKEEHPEIEASWYRSSNNLVLVTVADEKELGVTAARAECSAGLHVSWFREPDMEDALTAVAIEPGKEAGKLCANFPLVR